MLTEEKEPVEALIEACPLKFDILFFVTGIHCVY